MLLGIGQRMTRVKKAPPYRPHRLTTAQRRRAEERHRRIVGQMGELKQAVLHYLRFCIVNQLHPHDLGAYDGFIVQFQSRRSYNRRTLAEYEQDIAEYLTEPRRSQEERYRRASLEDTRSAAAREPRGHAPDYNLSFNRLLYENMLSPADRIMTWMGLALGLRPFDIDELGLRNIVLKRRQGILSSITVTVEVTKVISKAADRRNVTLEGNLLPGVEPPPELYAITGPGSTHSLATIEASAEQFNRALDRARGRSGLFARLGKPTSYTLRRNFVHRVIARCRLPSGEPDWSRIALYTLHFKEGTIRGHYELTANDLKLLGEDYDPWA